MKSVLIRPDSEGDRDSFKQVFLDKQYDLDLDIEPEIIFDCGAYVGYASYFFLNKYPDVKVYAFEPNNVSFELLRKHRQLWKNFKGQLIIQNIAIWFQNCQMGLDYKKKETATQVVENGVGVEALRLNAIIKDNKIPSIDLLKMDVEYSEYMIFNKNTQWLKITKNIAIELHNKQCRDMFMSAMSYYKYDLERRGELTICRNIQIEGEIKDDQR